MSLKVKNLITDIGKSLRQKGFKIFQIDKDLSIMHLGSRKDIDINEVAFLVLNTINSLEYDVDIKYLNRHAGAITINEENVKTMIEISIIKKKDI